MKLRRAKTDSNNREVSLGGSKAPVVRYYRPSKQRSDENRQNKAGQRTDKTRQPSAPNISIFWQSIMRWGGVFLILFLFFANLTLSKPVVGVSSNDNKGIYRSFESYVEGAQQIFNAKLLNRSKLTVNSTEIELAMREKFPEVSHATVIIPLAGRELQVLLDLSKPFARLQLAGNKQAVLSKDGRVLDIDEAQKASQSSFSSLISLSMPVVDAVAGQQILTSEELELMYLLQAEFDGSSINRPKLSSVEYDVQKREMRARFEGVKYYAKLSPEREEREQVGALLATIKSMAEQGRELNDYIDVRVEDRVFVK